MQDAEIQGEQPSHESEEAEPQPDRLSEPVDEHHAEIHDGSLHAGTQGRERSDIASAPAGTRQRGPDPERSETWAAFHQAASRYPQMIAIKYFNTQQLV
ncbi:hypothetical protein ACQVP2_01550 [Methylobacterium aquaticum]|uniref:hypothetical protein n=1 Tax=Methylobacterium aquaticum TaxID=270351 RepID=UPI003D174302